MSEKVGEAGSRLEGRTILQSSILKTLKCVACSKTVLTPSIQCKNSHLMCKTCLEPLAECSVCRERTFFENSAFIKKLLKALPRLCRYSDNGCKIVMEPNENQNHEMFCRFRPVTCKVKYCPEVVPLYKLKYHYKETHREYVLLPKGYAILDLPNLYQVQDYLHSAVFKLDHVFWIECRFRNGMFEMTFNAHFMDETHDNYCIDFYLKNGNLKLKFTLSPKQDGNMLNDSSCCIGMSYNSIWNFADDRGELIMHYEIKSVLWDVIDLTSV